LAGKRTGPGIVVTGRNKERLALGGVLPEDLFGGCLDRPETPRRADLAGRGGGKSAIQQAWKPALRSGDWQRVAAALSLALSRGT
jgi:hypothetical protein